MLDAEDTDGALYEQAVKVVRETRKCSTSHIQRHLSIGYNRAARLVERMEEAGIVTEADHIGKREVIDASNPKMTISTTGADGETFTSAPFTLSQMQEAGKRLRKADEASNGKSRMKSTPEDEAVKDNAYGIAAGELQQFIERHERLEEEKQDIMQQQREVMAEAKGRGYDTKIIRRVLALRKREPDDIAEEEAVLSMYLAALGMS